MAQSSRRPDCLNTIRLLAALQVVFVHARAHLQLDIPPVIGEVLCFISGVPVFFMLSGYLIWMSVGRSGSFRNYCAKRFWRIYPELWAAVAVEAIVLCVLGWQYVRWPDFGLFLFGQSTFFQFWTPDSLRPYGCGVPNGSLWTIGVIVQFYLVAWPLHKFLGGRGAAQWLASILSFTAVAVVSNILYWESVGFKLLANSIIPYLWMFACGAMVAEYKEKVVLVLRRWWWVPLLFFFAIKYTGYDVQALRYGVFFSLALFLSCLGIGYRFPALNIKTDISYGIYIYHMTAVNAVLVMFGPTGGLDKLLAVVMATILASYVSAVTVGRYCMGKKGGLKQSRE